MDEPKPIRDAMLHLRGCLNESTQTVVLRKNTGYHHRTDLGHPRVHKSLWQNSCKPWHKKFQNQTLARIFESKCMHEQYCPCRVKEETLHCKSQCRWQSWGRKLQLLIPTVEQGSNQSLEGIPWGSARSLGFQVAKMCSFLRRSFKIDVSSQGHSFAIPLSRVFQLDVVWRGMSFSEQSQVRRCFLRRYGASTWVNMGRTAWATHEFETFWKPKTWLKVDSSWASPKGNKRVLLCPQMADSEGRKVFLHRTWAMFTSVCAQDEANN